MISVLAFPGLMPPLLEISYPRYVIAPVPIWHLDGLTFKLCCLKRANTASRRFLRVS